MDDVKRAFDIGIIRFGAEYNFEIERIIVNYRRAGLNFFASVWTAT